MSLLAPMGTGHQAQTNRSAIFIGQVGLYICTDALLISGPPLPPGKVHKKASQRLYFISHLKMTNIPSSDIVKVYISFAHPVVE